MARLLIVSRSMALAMRLADQHEVNEHPVDDLEALGTDLDADVLVLDIGDPMQAVTTVNSLREAGQVTPVLLVSGYQPEWEQVEAQQVDGVVVVPLPITRAALLAGIAQLTGSPEPVLDAETANEVVRAEPAARASTVPDDAPEDAAALAETPVGVDVASGPVMTKAPGKVTAVQAVPATTAADPVDAADSGTEAEDDATAEEAVAVPAAGSDDDQIDDSDSTDQDAEDGPGDGGIDASDDVQPLEAPDPSEPPGAYGAGEPDGGAPAWGSPATPGNVPDFSDPQAFPSPAPPSPPWGETVRVGGPAADDAAAYSGQQPQAAPAVNQQAPAQGYGYGPDTGSQQVAAGPPSRRLPRLGNRPRKLQRRPNLNDTQGMGLVTDPLGPRTDPYGFPSEGQTGPAQAPAQNGATGPGAGSALDRRLDSEAAALAGDRNARFRPASGIVMRPADLVQSLLDQVGDLYGVSDTAQVLADDVIERADADAAAILVPDGPVWRVSGGVGLRPLERRLILESSHWLITEIGSAGRAVLIDDTDIIRPQLAGAPLAAWRHLLAVPVPDVRAIVVLARGQEAGPFTDRDLAAVIAPVREAAALLAQAVQTRRLARALSALREADTDAPPRRSS